MNDIDKNVLMEKLADNYSFISALLEGIDLDILVYEDSEWCLKDVVGHISTWDRQVTQSLLAFNAGKEYSIPAFNEDVFNQQQVVKGRRLPAQQVLNEWEDARKDIIAAIQEIPLDRFPGDVLYPWGDERGGIAELVEYMLDHDIEHRSEIVKAIDSR